MPERQVPLAELSAKEARRAIESHVGKMRGAADADTRRATRVLLWSVVLGPDEQAIASRVRIRPEQLKLFAERARANGIWTDRQVAGAEWFGRDGALSLVLDAAVLLGLVERKGANA
jgi:hypothetical protein